MKYYLILLTLFFTTSLFAGEGTWTKRYLLSDVNIGDDYSIFNQYQINQGNIDYSKSKGYVFLDYTRKNQTDLLSSVDWRVTVDFSYYDESNNLIVEELFIQFDEDHSVPSIYSDYAEVLINSTDNGYYVHISDIVAEYWDGTAWVQETDIPNSQYIPVDIDLKLEIRDEIIYELNVDEGTEELSVISFNASTYQLNWSYVEGAEEYDVEWVYIDEYSKEYEALTPILSDQNLLDNGGTELPFQLKEGSRVRVRGNNFQLDKTYATGRLYFRVRPVSVFATLSEISDDIKLGEWNYFGTGGTSLSSYTYHDIDGTDAFESGKNWLYSVSFAENGKSVSTVAFYDGSNRGRQNLSYNTSDDVTLIGEAKFDNEGRQTVSVIPAPIHGRELGYNTGFNLVNPTNTFDEEEIESTGNPGALFAPTSGESGAAQYFSRSNQFNDDLFRSGIPDANGYVYSQTVYRNDGSGRVESVGGIGADFTADGDHAVRTYYGSPTQTELIRLFGSNVSENPEGYRKNMVRDANGQYSVSYYDKRGNVIATGLTGEAPTNLMELEDQNDEYIVTSLNDNNNMIDPYTMQSEHTFMNAYENNDISLNYDLVGVVNQIGNQTIAIQDGYTQYFGDICTTCSYNLSIIVLDQNGNDVSGSPYVYNYVPSTDDCNQPSGPSYTINQVVSGVETPVSAVDINVTLGAIGEYRIIKRLEVNAESMQEAFSTSLGNLGYTNSGSFVNNYLLNVDFSSCTDNCNDYCIEKWKLERRQSYGSLYTTLEDAMAAADAEWDNVIDKELVLANCMTENCNVDDEISDLNYIDDYPTGGVSMCESLKTAMVNQVKNDGVLFPQQLQDLIDGGSTLTFDVDGTSQNLQYFIDNPDKWTDEMALYLVDNNLHRESCHLNTCGEWSASLKFSMELAYEMHESGWDNTSTLYTQPWSASSLGIDPFVGSSFNTFSGLSSDLEDRVLAYYFYYPEPSLSSYIGANAPLVDYVEGYVNWLIYTYPSTYGIGNNNEYYLTPDNTEVHLDELRIQIFKGLYDKIKEDIIREYNESSIPSCQYYDVNGIFKSNSSVSQAQYVENIINGLNNSLSSCETRAMQNTLKWLDEIPQKCLLDLQLMAVDAQPNPNGSGLVVTLSYNFDQDDLQAAYDAGTSSTLPELFYAYYLEVCDVNVAGYFYDPDSDDSAPDDPVPGEDEFDGIMTILTSLDNSDCLFELDNFPLQDCPVGNGITLNYTINESYNTNSNYVTDTEIENAIEQLINFGLDQCVSYQTYSYNTSSSCKTIGHAYSNYNVNLLNNMFGSISLEMEQVRCKQSAFGPYYEVSWRIKNLSFEVRNAGNCVYDGQLTVPIYLDYNGLGIWLEDIQPITATFTCSDIHSSNTATLYVECDTYSTVNDSQYLSFSSTCGSGVCNPCSTYTVDLNLPNIEWPCNAELSYDPVQNCIDEEIIQATNDAQWYYDQFLAQLYDQSLENIGNCLDNATEDFTMGYHLKEYQYTLYYYDLVGNLVQTVPPQGVHPVETTNFDANGVWNGVEPLHDMETRYKYNGLNTLVEQFTPDGGRTYFLLDDLYRVRFSINARQVVERKASYSKYDELGRVIEAGEFYHDVEWDTPAPPQSPGPMVLLNYNISNNSYPSTDRLDYTETYYESACPENTAAIESLFTDGKQVNLRNAIGAIMHSQVIHMASNGELFEKRINTVISYSYDAHKNVKEMVSTNYLVGGGQEHKKVEYEYDLLSGNVNEVIYQKGRSDAYRHKYHYDANNRLIRTFTSLDEGVTWDNDAKYFYYLHGPLARVELGQDKVQGQDYVYKLQGWLKGVNSATLDKNRDVGKDGTDGLNRWSGVDSYGYQLGYYQDDYESIDLNFDAFASTTTLQTNNNNDLAGSSQEGNNHGSLYNGNITHMVTAMKDDNENVIDILGNNYRYDQLQRIKAMDVYHSPNLRTQNNFTNAALYRVQNGESAYMTRYSFDKNGNLLSLKRNGSGSNGNDLEMDDFSYFYQNEINQNESPSLIVATPVTQNILANVSDNVLSDVYDADIDAGQNDQIGASQVSNYEYDLTGQLIADAQENIDSIKWTPTGKVKQIYFTPSSGMNDLMFVYDPMDMRVAKMEKVLGCDFISTTLYTYDASGNPLATYNRDINIPILPPGESIEGDYTDIITLNEFMIYGSSRLGVHKQDKIIYEGEIDASLVLPNSTELNLCERGWSEINGEELYYDFTNRVVGNKYYELSNHLGNVLNVITDRKIARKVGEKYSNDFSSSYTPMYPTGTSILSIDAGTLKVDNAEQWKGVRYNLETVPGHIYTVNANIQSSVLITFFAKDNLSAQNLDLVQSTGNNNVALEFIAQSTLTTIIFENSTSSTTTFNIDDFIIEDISKPIITLFENDFSSTTSPFYGTGTTQINYDSANERLQADNVEKWKSARYDAATIPGRIYRVTADIDLNSGGDMSFFARDMILAQNLDLVTVTEDGTYSVEFVAQNNYTVIVFENKDDNIRSFYLDNFKYEDISEYHYVADVVSYSDYYPYGMLMDGRHGQAESQYRYGFQGQEMDNEIKGEGNSVNYKYRMHDPRIGRFFAIDPLTAKYPHYSPYGFSGNKVIHAIELEGMEEIVVINGEAFWNYSSQNKVTSAVDIGFLISDGIRDYIAIRQISPSEIAGNADLEAMVNAPNTLHAVNSGFLTVDSPTYNTGHKVKFTSTNNVPAGTRYDGRGFSPGPNNIYNGATGTISNSEETEFTFTLANNSYSNTLTFNSSDLEVTVQSKDGTVLGVYTGNVNKINIGAISGETINIKVARIATTDGTTDVDIAFESTGVTKDTKPISGGTTNGNGISVSTTTIKFIPIEEHSTSEQDGEELNKF